MEFTDHVRDIVKEQVTQQGDPLPEVAHQMGLAHSTAWRFLDGFQPSANTLNKALRWLWPNASSVLAGHLRSAAERVTGEEEHDFPRRPREPYEPYDEGLRHGKTHQRAKDAALVRAAGCSCWAYIAAGDFRGVVSPAEAPIHDPRCPGALAARIEAGE